MYSESAVGITDALITENNLLIDKMNYTLIEFDVSLFSFSRVVEATVEENTPISFSS